MSDQHGWISSNRGRGRSIRGRGRGLDQSQTHFPKLSQNYRTGTSRGNTSRDNISKDPRDDPNYQNFLATQGKIDIPDREIDDDQIDQDNEIDFFNEKNYTEIIFLLENIDLKWKNNPYFLMTRYLNNNSFPIQTYKNREFYQGVLEHSQSCIFKYEKYNKNCTDYKFSKVIIKKVISQTEWGITLTSCKEFLLTSKNSMIQYNYWDYIQAFDKVFFYENDDKKHTWFIKICAEVYSSEFPNWFVNWWANHGPSSNLLPANWKDYYHYWLDVSPTINQLIQADQIIGETGPMHFFIEFSIPWIFRWMPKFGYSERNLPCIKRHFFTRLWTKMFLKDQDTGQLRCQETLDKITETLTKYRKLDEDQKENPMSFSQLTAKLKLKKGLITPEEIKKAYQEAMIKEIEKIFAEEFNPEDLKSLRSDTEMASNASNNSEFAQDPYEIEGRDLEDFLCKGKSKAK